MSATIPEGKFVDVGDDLRVHYHEAGEGPAVVFLHGSGPGASGYSNFKRNFPAIAAAGFRAVVPDTLGFGYSSKPTDRKYTIDFMVDGVIGLLDALGIDTCSLVGNSAGGAMCIRLALRHPERVSKMVLMAPGGLETRETYMEMAGIKAMIRAIFGREGLTHESLRRVFELQLYDPSDIEDDVVAERLAIAEAQPQWVIQTMRIPNQQADLPKITCPVLGFWGTDDQFCPVSGAMKLATGCADAKVMLVSRCGHWVMVEHTEMFNRMSIEFLSGP